MVVMIPHGSVEHHLLWEAWRPPWQCPKAAQTDISCTTSLLANLVSEGLFSSLRRSSWCRRTATLIDVLAGWLQWLQDTHIQLRWTMCPYSENAITESEKWTKQTKDGKEGSRGSPKQAKAITVKGCVLRTCLGTCLMPATSHISSQQIHRVAPPCKWGKWSIK